MKSFGSDNHSGAHENIIKAIIKCNEGHVHSYGDDLYTKAGINKIKEHLGDVDVYFVFNGTGANILSLGTLVKPYECIICPETAHINTDETGAVEHTLGTQLRLVKTVDGKLRVDDIKPFLHVFGEMHHSQPKIVSISNSTELGTVYTAEEIKAIADFVHANDMYLHVDGARIFNAAVSQNKTIKEITGDVGVDVLSLGGTKNGMLFGEAVVFFNKELSKHAMYIRKQNVQLASKMRYIGAQFEAMFTNDLAYNNARNSNAMAKMLYEGIKDLKGIEAVYSVDSNGLFIKLPAHLIPVLQEKVFFYIWDYEESIVRWMTSFDTTKEDIETFIKIIKESI